MNEGDFRRVIAESIMPQLSEAAKDARAASAGITELTTRMARVERRVGIEPPAPGGGPSAPPPATLTVRTTQTELALEALQGRMKALETKTDEVALDVGKIARKLRVNDAAISIRQTFRWIQTREGRRAAFQAVTFLMLLYTAARETLVQVAAPTAHASAPNVASGAPSR